MSNQPAPDRPRIAALVDLPRSSASGGHVKYWEQIARAAAGADDFPFDLTVYFSGGDPEERLAAHVRLRSLKPIFSTKRLKFLPYVPDHTDLAPYHPQLARELSRYDLVHTTDGFFAFAGAAARVTRAKRIPLATSFHTDTPAYAELFTRQTIESLLARWPWLKRKLIEEWRAPERQRMKMEQRLAQHVRGCAHVFTTRAPDRALAERILDLSRVSALRLGVDKILFNSSRRDADGVRRAYAIPDDRVVALFVGRVDAGKNVPVLMEAAAHAIAAGAPLHLIVAGVGPMREELAARLLGHISLPGFVEPLELARLYASVDFVALPSEVEIGGMATLEAIAAGCPLLVARASGSAELFDNAEAIRIVDGGADAWTAALIDMTKVDERRRAMRAAALQCANGLATWSDVLRDDLTPGWRAALERRT